MPNHKVAARKEKARRAVLEFGLELDISPAEALLQEVRRSAGVVAWLGEQIHQVVGEDPASLIWGTKSETRQTGRTAEGPVDTTTTAEAAAVNLWWELWSKERAHLIKAAAAAHAAGVAEHQIRIAEQFGERMGQLMMRSHEDAGLNLGESEMRRLMQAVAANLHILEGAA
ncbi:hypothetical protein Kisp02_54570 [Kineosporia sp. NBRC 101731]|nr:hypothetical protein Kisp02_54570 [Kineosporia sp. NBRC 101731]